MPIPKQAIKNAKKALKERNKFKDKPMTSSGVKTAKMLTTGYYTKEREGKNCTSYFNILFNEKELRTLNEDSFTLRSFIEEDNLSSSGSKGKIFLV